MSVIKTESLMRRLEQDFPNRLPTKRDVSMEEIQFAMGEQKVINYLRKLFEEQDPTEGLLDVFSTGRT